MAFLAHHATLALLFSTGAYAALTATKAPPNSAVSRILKRTIRPVNIEMSQLIPPLSFAVVNTFRPSAFQLFNPTNSTPPFFQIFDDDFLHLLGASPFIKPVASRTDGFAFKAPIFVPETNEMFFASSIIGATLELNNRVGKINVTEIQAALAANVKNINVIVQEVSRTKFKTQKNLMHSYGVCLA